MKKKAESVCVRDNRMVERKSYNKKLKSKEEKCHENEWTIEMFSNSIKLCS